MDSPDVIPEVPSLDDEHPLEVLNFAVSDPTIYPEIVE